MFGGCNVTLQLIIRIQTEVKLCSKKYCEESFMLDFLKNKRLSCTHSKVNEKLYFSSNLLCYHYR